MASLADEQRAFFAAHLGISESDLTRKSASELQSLFNAKRFATTTTPKPAVTAPTAAGALYAQAQSQSVVDAVNSIRTALQGAGIIQ